MKAQEASILIGSSCPRGSMHIGEAPQKQVSMMGSGLTEKAELLSRVSESLWRTGDQERRRSQSFEE
jgi:hypothetical protein